MKIGFFILLFLYSLSWIPLVGAAPCININGTPSYQEKNGTFFKDTQHILAPSERASSETLALIAGNGNCSPRARLECNIRLGPEAGPPTIEIDEAARTYTCTWEFTCPSGAVVFTHTDHYLYTMPGFTPCHGSSRTPPEDSCPGSCEGN